MIPRTLGQRAHEQCHGCRRNGQFIGRQQLENRCKDSGFFSIIGSLLQKKAYKNYGF